jgi:hypothetical protein
MRGVSAGALYAGVEWVRSALAGLFWPGSCHGSVATAERSGGALKEIRAEVTVFPGRGELVGSIVWQSLFPTGGFQ